MRRVWLALVGIGLVFVALAEARPGRRGGRERGASAPLATDFVGATLARPWDHCWVGAGAAASWAPAIGTLDLDEVGTATWDPAVSTAPLRAQGIGSDNIGQAITPTGECWSTAGNQTVAFPVAYRMIFRGVPDDLRMAYLGSGSVGFFHNYSSGNNRFEFDFNDEGGGSAGTIQESRHHPSSEYIMVSLYIEADGSVEVCTNGWCTSESVSTLSVGVDWGINFGMAFPGYLGFCLNPAHEFDAVLFCYDSGSSWWTEAAELADCRANGTCAPAVTNPSGVVATTGFERTVAGYHCGGELTGFAPELDAPEADCNSTAAGLNGAQGAAVAPGEAIRYEYSAPISAGVQWWGYNFRETAARDPAGGMGTGSTLWEIGSDIDSDFPGDRTAVQFHCRTDGTWNLYCNYTDTTGAQEGVTGQASNTWAGIACGYDWTSSRGACWGPRTLSSGQPTETLGVASLVADCSSFAPRAAAVAEGVRNYSPSGGDIHLDDYVAATDAQRLANAEPDNSYSVFLDGVNDYISIAHGAPVDFTTAYTVAGWFYFDSLTASDTIARKLTGTSDVMIQWRLRSADANQMVAFIGSTSTYCQTTADHLTTGAWTHLALVYDGGQANADRVTFYQNGAEVACSVNGTIPTTVATLNTAEIRIGDGASGMEGNVDELAIWARALSGAEVTTLYNSGVPDFILNNAGWPVGWWRMGDNDASSPARNILGTTNGSAANAALNGGAAFVSEVP